MTRPLRFEHFRYLGDKRTQIVHDLDNAGEACKIDELIASEQFTTFAPDTIPEARNRGYKPCPHCVVPVSSDEDDDEMS